MKFLYIDTNQYRHLYSQNEGFSDEIHSLICKLIDSDHVKLLLPQQTDDEIQRNRLRDWPEAHKKSIEKQIKTVVEKSTSARENFAEYDKSSSLIKEIENHSKNLSKRIDKEVERFVKDTSAPNKKLFGLLKRSERITETDTVFERAERRFKKGNPPYDTKIGDHLIWESLIERLAQESKPELIFVGNDNKAWGPDRWLSEEFNKRTSGSVVFVKRLSDIPVLTAAEQKKIKEAEEKNSLANALEDFVNSQSFIDAGANARRLLGYQDKLDETDLIKIFDAARTNFEIYQSFFTSEPLRQLLGTDSGFVRPSLESIDENEWVDFENKNRTGLKRQTDEIDDSPINLDDIPF